MSAAPKWQPDPDALPQGPALHAIRDGARTFDALRRVLGIGTDVQRLRNLIANLQTRSLIHKHRDDSFSVTKLGHELIARAPEAPLRPYVPPKAAPRRPGSMDYAQHPSVSAGVARHYWGAR